MVGFSRPFAGGARVFAQAGLAQAEPRSRAVPRSRRGFACWCIALAFLLPVAGQAEAGAGPYHEDDRIGFKIRSPRDWNAVAMRAEEEWIVGKFISDRVHTATGERGTSTHRPEMTMITFIKSVVSKSGVEKSEDADGDVTIEIHNPYKNYQDFLKRTYSGGGWYVSAEEEDDLKGVPVTQYEIKVEKLATPKRLVTWVYHLPGVDLAVQFEVIEEAYPKLRGDITACLKSLRTITRTRALTAEITGTKEKRVDEDELTLEERTAYRKKKEAEVHKRTIDALPDDWKVVEMGRFLVLLHGDEKFAKKIATQAEAMWAWLDKTFPFYGEGEYVSRPIIRVCRDYAEERAIIGGTSSRNSLEMITHRDPNAGSGSGEFAYVNRRMLSLWFSSRNRDAWWAAPWWLSFGLDAVIGAARCKGSRVDFEVSPRERDRLRESSRAETLTPPRELVMLHRSAFMENPDRRYHSSAFVRFLLSSKNKKAKKVLVAYMRSLQDMVAERKAAEKAKEGSSGESSRPKTEEEEEEMLRKRREGLKEQEAEFLQGVYDRAFSEWSDRDWRRLQDAYYKTMK